jgi:transposase
MMQDRELYRQILGIQPPWSVDRVELKLAETGEVRVYLEHEFGIEWPCAECGKPCRLYDHQAERKWRHLDTCQYRTILYAKPPRSECPEHGVRIVKLPWAEPGSRFTALFEAVAISWLKQASQKAVAEQLQLSWDEIHLILERAVERGLKRRQTEAVKRLGIDEKAYKKGHRYLTIVNDLDRNRVLYVAEDREETSLDGFWPTLTDSQLQSIEAGNRHVGCLSQLIA